ncbi:hypothetical protein [Streptomyces sp. NBC_00996]|uniref:hypothetical protein n=1 Tax=Streptomyces sp. NBC_00996 TaxID=2903710 RepID=UPI00386BD260|nr:hypothetical protein OG390_09130 [Streptomyces sp. NBC_00996]
MARFEVHISDEGFAEIDGDPLVSEPGQSVHEAVLDQLQRYAQERGAAVEATVNDRPGAAHFALEMSPDGSSRILVPEEAPAPEPEPVLVASVTAPDLAEAPAPSAVATAIARARARAVAGDRVAAAPAQLSAGTIDLPAELAEPIGRINALAVVGRLDEAFADATALRERLTGSMGAEHPHALEARAVEAYLAHLCGEHREATVLALAVARIACGAGDDRAPEEVARAAAAWQRLDDDQAALTHGHELLHMWAKLERRGLLPPGHSELAEQVRRHVWALMAYA